MVATRYQSTSKRDEEKNCRPAADSKHKKYNHDLHMELKYNVKHPLLVQKKLKRRLNRFQYLELLQKVARTFEGVHVSEKLNLYGYAHIAPYSNKTGCIIYWKPSRYAIRVVLQFTRKFHNHFKQEKKILIHTLTSRQLRSITTFPIASSVL